ncbi:HAMP domain-containing histidine kinase [Aquiflexum sp. TKW24L]|uniref:sensor histidine kinase n=1 Tax=Aquiflexum sp. TKW24L TaxID=2942212 RepID=UPI0020C10561|nr:HAMP domain-containing sensor histidine kinase [Aquiflexum sp. TKW24L]MCL6261377.1 HAMP domain-containing histidine kinase [Aquiflexum sp. TKW24L]
MQLSSKMILYNLLAKGVILLVFLMSGPFFLKYFAVKNTDNRLLEKREQVLEIIRIQGLENFFLEEDYSSGFGSYNILKEEYILLERIAEPFLVDTIYNEERIIENESVTYRVCSYVFSSKGEYFLLEIGRSLETIKDIEKIIFRILYITFFIFLLLTFFLDTAFGKWLVRPFKQIVENKLLHIKEPQQFQYSPIETSTDEFRLLDVSLSDMMKRIQKAFNQEREFISHASHELKTPLSILQSKVEGFFNQDNLNQDQMEKLIDMQSTVQKMKKMVNSLLLISKVSNAQFLKSDSVVLQNLLLELYEEWKPMADEKNIILLLEKNDHFEFTTNESLCTMMVQNALVNSLKYTPEGGQIKMSGVNSTMGYQITIADNGPGILEDIMDQIKEGTVFLKNASKDKSGFGLQLIYKIGLFLNIKVQIDTKPTGTTVFFNFNKII